MCMGTSSRRFWRRTDRGLEAGARDLPGTRARWGGRPGPPDPMDKSGSHAGPRFPSADSVSGTPAFGVRSEAGRGRGRREQAGFSRGVHKRRVPSAAKSRGADDCPAAASTATGTPPVPASSALAQGRRPPGRVRPDPHRRPALDELAAAGHTIDFAATRRNVLTRGIDVNPLVGRTFLSGDVLCQGRRLREPCAHLDRLSGPGLIRPLIHTGRPARRHPHRRRDPPRSAGPTRLVLPRRSAKPSA